MLNRVSGVLYWKASQFNLTRLTPSCRSNFLDAGKGCDEFSRNKQMLDTLSVTMLPAKEGDCLLISYGEEFNRKYILIDAGRAWTYEQALKGFLSDNGVSRLELLVVTHVDRDHIEGVLSLVKDPELKLEVKNIWFNTWEHLFGHPIVYPGFDADLKEFGVKMGEELSIEIIAKGWRWNRHFGGQAVERYNDPTSNIILLDDIILTLLSPDRAKLETLIPTWNAECLAAGLTPGVSVEDYAVPDDALEESGTIDIETLAEEDFIEDHSAANGSSIAFILQYKNLKILLAGDAHSGLLVESLKALGFSIENPIVLDLFKIPHHASKFNLSKDLIQLMRCENYFVSTNGNYSKHPDNVALARLIKYSTTKPSIVFNYRTSYTKLWENSNWQKKYGYTTRYPKNKENGYNHLDLIVV
ncbi:ComEC/Rec2 family competence protein [Geopsychrobacter electrodiphilus]|uniref:ComEC/Rec2 family competence protein n=1 Tax=Geopsychrobacter electrodiphilus TaxID=225196 RepID=UPI0012EC847E|nr:hypothetical protein [Geopsychrobacter electrodiphilus]